MEEKNIENVIKEQMLNTYNNGILIGAQTICSVLMNEIYKFESSQCKKSTNDYKRNLKNIKHICETGVSKKFEDIKHKVGEFKSE